MSVRPYVRPYVPCYFERWKVRKLGDSCAVYPALFFSCRDQNDGLIISTHGFNVTIRRLPTPPNVPRYKLDLFGSWLRSKRWSARRLSAILPNITAMSCKDAECGQDPVPPSVPFWVGVSISNSFPVHTLVLCFNRPINSFIFCPSHGLLCLQWQFRHVSQVLFPSGLGKIWRAKHQFRINLLALELIIQSVGVCVEIKIINS